LVLWWGGIACAAGVAGDGLRAFVAERPFGWRQPLTAAVVAVAVGVPLATIGWWVWDSGTGVLDRGPATPVPDYLADSAIAPVASSTLVLSGSVEDGLTYTLVRDDGTRLGEEAVAPTVSERAGFDAGVSALLREPSEQRVFDLADHGVGAVYALPPVDASVAAALDAAPGLQRSGAPQTGARAWQLSAEAGSIRLVPAEAGTGSAVPIPATSGLVGSLSLPLEQSGTERRLVLATPASPGWTAAGPDGTLPTAVVSSGVQAFEAPPDAVMVELDHDSTDQRSRLLQVGLLVVLVLAALPGRRQHR